MSSKHTGRCLCGEVKYEITGEAKNFLYCQCSRCQKSTGSAHASNLFVAANDIHWISGKNKIKSFKVPDAERYMRHFCADCGSPVPIYIEARGMALIPAGTLDTGPTIKPQARIFHDSRAVWTNHDELVCFPEYPE